MDADVMAFTALNFDQSHLKWRAVQSVQALIAV
jgi:hypothetical protein